MLTQLHPPHVILLCWLGCFHVRSFAFRSDCGAGTYYIITSHLTGWSPNPLMLYRAAGKTLDDPQASGRNKQPPLATKNLLEDTDGLRRPPSISVLSMR